MIPIKDQKQDNFLKSWAFLSQKKIQLLNCHSRNLYKDTILPELSVDKLSQFFNNGLGNPTEELNPILNTMILQQTFDFTDEETIEELLYKIQWYYTLNITERYYLAEYMPPKPIWNICSIAFDNSLHRIMFEKSPKVTIN